MGVGGRHNITHNITAPIAVSKQGKAFQHTLHHRSVCATCGHVSIGQDLVASEDTCNRPRQMTPASLSLEKAPSMKTGRACANHLLFDLLLASPALPASLCTCPPSEQKEDLRPQVRGQAHESLPADSPNNTAGTARDGLGRVQDSDMKENKNRKKGTGSVIFSASPQSQREIVQMVMLLAARLILGGHVITIKACYFLHWAGHSAEVAVM